MMIGINANNFGIFHFGMYFYSDDPEIGEPSELGI